MNKDELERETHLRGRVAPVPVLAAVLFALAAVTGAVGTHPRVEELTLDLIVAHKRFPLDLIGAVINAGGLLALAAVLSFLWGATSARKPNFSVAVRYVALAGGALAAISGLVYAVLIAVAANKFVTTGQETYSEAHRLTSATSVIVPPLIGQAALLMLAVATVLICLNAMRVGLLPKLMGYVGIFVGILFLFPIGALAPLIQAAWLGALGYLFFGRWPSGHPPAWSSGEAVPWPSNQQVREQRTRPARGGRGKPVPAPSPEPVVAPAAGTTRATTPKRKRKRRN